MRGPSVSTDAANNASALVLQGDDLDALSDDPNDLQADLQALAGPSAGPNGGSIFIDGFSGGDLPAKESIREIRINQNPFSPEYDKLGYGRIEIFTKPGMDKYRGHRRLQPGHTSSGIRAIPTPPRRRRFCSTNSKATAAGPSTSGRRSLWMRSATWWITAPSRTASRSTPNLAIQPVLQRHRDAGALHASDSARRLPAERQQHADASATAFTHSDAQDAGIGGFDLISRGYHNQFTNQTVQVAETAVLGTSINETRFQYYRSASQMIANSTSPEIQVLGAFNGGGSLNGRTFDTQNSFELQNYTSMMHGAHSLEIRRAAARPDGRQCGAAEFQRHVHVWRRRAGAGAGCQQSAGTGRCGQPVLAPHHFHRAIPAHAAVPATGHSRHRRSAR